MGSIEPGLQVRQGLLVEAMPWCKPALAVIHYRAPVAHDGALEGLRPGAECQAASRQPALLDTQRQQNAVDRLSHSMPQLVEYLTLQPSGLLFAGHKLPNR